MREHPLYSLQVEKDRYVITKAVGGLPYMVATGPYQTQRVTPEVLDILNVALKTLAVEMRVYEIQEVHIEHAITSYVADMLTVLSLKATMAPRA